MTSYSYGDLSTPLWDPILHQLYKMANHELQHLRSLYVLSVSNDRFLYKTVGNMPNQFATSCSDSGRWVEMKDFNSYLGSDWFEDLRTIV